MVSGDCLWNIAKKYYGDGSQYTKIYEANKGTIGSNPPDQARPEAGDPMSYELNAGGKQLAEVIEKVTWSGDSKQVARKLVFTVANKDSDRFLPKVNINEGDQVQFLEDGKLLFHCAREGHKLDAVARCDKASFCVIDQDRVVPEEYTTYFRSVIAFGRIRVIGDDGRGAPPWSGWPSSTTPATRRNTGTATSTASGPPCACWR